MSSDNFALQNQPQFRRKEAFAYAKAMVMFMSLINVTGLTFVYDGSYDNIFENVRFQLDTDWRLGFTGRNGRGKTTFLNLLQGKYEYKGSISANVSFEYFPYEVASKEDFTIDVVKSVCPSCMEWELLRELSLLEVSEDTLYRPFSTLSNGEQTKALLAGLFLKENSFLLIDEPTNHLDESGRQLVSRYLRKKSGFILVSHDRAFLDDCVDHILSINKANIEVQKGNFSSWWHNKQLQDEFELAENEKLKKEVKRLEKTAKEKADWSVTAESRKIGFDPSKTEKSTGRRAYEGAKSKKAMKRSKAIEVRHQSAFEEKSKLLKNLEDKPSLKISPIDFHASRLVYFNDVSISYGENEVCSNVNFAIEQGDRVALCGKNGTGKSSIIKLICGDSISYTGDFQRNHQLKISYVSQDTSMLNGSLDDYARDNEIDINLFKSILQKLDFSHIQFEKLLESYSGGQKKKVLIAKSLCEQAHLYIWDEPLNFIDVISRMQIEELLLLYKPTTLFVEHDKAFRENIATKLINL